MSIPIIAGPIGYDSWYVKVFRNICDIVVDPNKFVLDWIAPEKKLVVHTDRLDDTTSYRITSMLEYTVPAGIEVVRYNHHIEVSWRDINKYVECMTPKDMYAVDPEKNLYIKIGSFSKAGYFIGDFCSDGSFPYPLPELTSVNADAGYASNAFLGLVVKYGIKKLEVTLPKLKNWTGGSTSNGIQLKEIILDAPNLETFTENYSFELKRFKCNSLKIKNVSNLAWQSPIESIESDFPVLENGKISVNNGILDKASVLRICNTVPTWTTGTHELWLGIHIDHQNDEEVLAAISNAEAKGWTLTVQWNPGGPVYTTPTA